MSSPEATGSENEIEKAAVLARTGKLKEAEGILQPLLAQEATAAEASYELGLIYYEINEPGKAIKYFKDTLTKTLPPVPTRRLQDAIDLVKAGKAEESEKILLTLLDDEATAIRARYELGLIYESKDDLDNAAIMLRDAQVLIADKMAAYEGTSNCKKCHIKEFNGWKKTKMARALDSLKPGMAAEAKIKAGFDPQKDYTKDTKCLECHTTGFGMPGGYKIPEKDDLKAVKRAQENEGASCESCHGPGSKYVEIHNNALTKKEKYTLDELYQTGQYEINIKTCTTCHNLRNPTSGPDYHFDFEKFKTEDTHERFPLKYRQE
ncbi:MAG: multiheme c-type cytochrome [Planctomycetota bacterium]